MKSFYGLQRAQLPKSEEFLWINKKAVFVVLVNDICFTFYPSILLVELTGSRIRLSNWWGAIFYFLHKKFTKVFTSDLPGLVTARHEGGRLTHYKRRRLTLTNMLQLLMLWRAHPLSSH